TTRRFLVIEVIHNGRIRACDQEPEMVVSQDSSLPLPGLGIILCDKVEKVSRGPFKPVAFSFFELIARLFVDDVKGSLSQNDFLYMIRLKTIPFSDLLLNLLNLRVPFRMAFLQILSPFPAGFLSLRSLTSRAGGCSGRPCHVFSSYPLLTVVI